MSLNARKIKNKGGKKFPPVEAGTYPARLVQVIDLGVQAQRPYKGQEKPPVNEIMFTYELLDEFLPDEEGVPDETKPRWQSETMPLHNLSAELAKSTKRYNALDPEGEHGGDFSKLLGVPCMITLIHNANAADPDFPYVNIAAVSAMRAKEAAKAVPLVNPAKFIDLDEPDLEAFGSLPDWIQDKIKGALNFGGSALAVALAKGPKKAPQQKKPEPEPEGAVEGEEDW